MPASSGRPPLPRAPDWTPPSRSHSTPASGVSPPQKAKREEKSEDNRLFDPPSDLVCPISHEVYSDPVINSAGQVRFSYDSPPFAFPLSRDSTILLLQVLPDVRGIYMINPRGISTLPLLLRLKNLFGCVSFQFESSKILKCPVPSLHIPSPDWSEQLKTFFYSSQKSWPWQNTF